MTVARRKAGLCLSSGLFLWSSLWSTAYHGGLLSWFVGLVGLVLLMANM